MTQTTVNKLYRGNLETWLLLESHQDFIERTRDYRNSLLKAEQNNEGLNKRLDDLEKYTFNLMEDFNVPILFKLAISNYIQYGRIDTAKDIPAHNYMVYPRAINNSRLYTHNVGERGRSVQIEVFSRLSTDEFDLLREELVATYDECFPDVPSLARHRKKDNLERDLAMEEMASTRDSEYGYKDLRTPFKISDTNVIKQAISRLNKLRESFFGS